MTPQTPSTDAVLDVLSDPECRCLLETLDDPTTAQEAADRCELAQTTVYRKLERLSDAALVEERVDVRADGHHATAYVRDFTGVAVVYGGDGFDVDVVSESELAAEAEDTDTQSADQRLATFWSQISEEL